jgi:glyoxylase-like metal-dependent hydrolase (beta-lactamase superfamily II)
VVYDTASKDAVIIDPVLDFDAGSGTISTRSAQELYQFTKEAELNIGLILETHAHADHLSGSQFLKALFPKAQIAIGEHIGVVQAEFKRIYHFPADFPVDGSQFDRLIRDHEHVNIGTLAFEALATPGHTPACMSYRFNDCVFVGDALFMPDYGTGRCDFPGGDARQLYQSITKRLYTLPDTTRIFTGHDYLPNGRALRFEATVAEQKASNIQLPNARTEDDYVTFREQRDKTLSAPKLLHQSVQVNIAAGHLPCQESNGMCYLKIPLTFTAAAS